MKSIYLLGIDIGTQSTKVAIIDQKGNLKGLGQVRYNIQQPYSTWVEIDPEVWWQAIVKGVNIALNQILTADS